MRAWSLKDHPRHLAELRFTLDSLRESGDLAQDQHGKYSLLGKTVETLSKFEVEERRAQSAAKANNWLVRLTFVLAVAAIVQVLVTIFSASK